MTCKTTYNQNLVRTTTVATSAFKPNIGPLGCDLLSTFLVAAHRYWSHKYAKQPSESLSHAVKIAVCVSQSPNLSQSTLQWTSPRRANFPAITLTTQRAQYNTGTKKAQDKHMLLMVYRTSFYLYEVHKQITCC